MHTVTEMMICFLHDLRTVRIHVYVYEYVYVCIKFLNIADSTLTRRELLNFVFFTTKNLLIF